MTSMRPQDILHNMRNSRKMVLVIVFVALFLDNMLLTVVVPIVPNFLRRLEKSKHAVNSSRQIIEKTAQIPQIVLECVNKTIETSQSIQNESTNSSFSSMEVALICHNETQWKNTTRREDGGLFDDAEYSKNVEVGLMFASKAIMQLLANPFIGPITNRIGYTIPMFTGFIIMMVSTIIFAFGETYAVLFVARTVQGIGSSCSSVAGMGMVATFYPDDKERGNAMGIALSGLALGVLVGPPFGGVMYEFAGKASPFLILASLAFLDGCLQLLTLQLSVKPEAQEGTALKQLLKDPYILIAAGAITFGNMGIAMLEPSMPIWMYGKMHAPEWEQGIAFLPASLSYLLGTNIFGHLAHKMGRWLSTLVGMVIIGICCLFLPFSENIGHLIAPTFGIGFAIGMVDSSMLPHMGYLVDLRHVSVYGSVYAIADVAFCLGFTIGPALSGTLVSKFGFKIMMWIIAVVSFLYAPLMYFLRNPPAKEEKMSLIMNDQCPVQYVTYNQNEYSPDSEYDDY